MENVNNGITYDYINNILDDIEDKYESNEKFSTLDAKLNILFAYAKDFIEAAEDEKIESLVHTEIDNVYDAILKTYYYEKEQRLSLENIKEILIKKIGSYEMIVHYNLFLNNPIDAEHVNVEIVARDKESLEVTDLILKVNGKFFDIFKEVKECIMNDFVFDGEIPMSLIDELGININDLEVIEEDDDEDDDDDGNIFMPRMDRFSKSGEMFLKNVYAVGATNKKIGRNDPCPCGSGKKYKQCCGK